MIWGDVKAILKNRLRQQHSEVDEAVRRAVNLASLEVARLRPWWFLKGVREASTTVSGNTARQWLSTFGILAAPAEGGISVLVGSTKLNKGEGTEAALLTGSTPEYWWLDDGELVVCPVIGPTGPTVTVVGYWIPGDVEIGAADPDTKEHALIRYVPELVIERAWLELCYFAGRLSVTEAQKLWWEYLSSYITVVDRLAKS